MTVFDEQNTKIDKGLIQGEKIEVTALMINKYAVTLESLLICLIFVEVGGTTHSSRIRPTWTSRRTPPVMDNSRVML